VPADRVAIHPALDASAGPTTSAVDDGTHWIPATRSSQARDHLSGVALNGKVYAIGGE